MTSLFIPKVAEHLFFSLSLSFLSHNLLVRLIQRVWVSETGEEKEEKNK